MDFLALTKGFLAGAAIAAPLGPVGVLCIHRGLFSGRAAAFASGLGAASAHGTYALIAALGLSAVSGTMARHGLFVRAAAGALLCVIGIRIFLAAPSDTHRARTGTSLAGAYASTFLLAISSPVTMLTIAAVFSGARLPGPAGGTAAALVLSAGVFLGSASWWLLLSSGLGWLSRRGGTAVRSANRIGGALLLAFGVYVVLGLLVRW